MTKEEKIVEHNAIIESVSLSVEDHGVLSSFVMLDYGGTGQGFGGYVLYLPKSFTHHAKSSVAGHWIWRVLEIAGVKEWDELPGKTIRVRRVEWGKIQAIGHIVKDDWFYPEKEFTEWRLVESEAK